MRMGNWVWVLGLVWFGLGVDLILLAGVMGLGLILLARWLAAMGCCGVCVRAVC